MQPAPAFAVLRTAIDCSRPLVAAPSQLLESIPVTRFAHPIYKGGETAAI